ncbi:hypothetical protein QA641_33515 [Bradyrhizobium sp. CB1650]|uniref:hypothetical protein n=1 Tax=Bradyrhizobium sp. CB1650 TaxID=3039153 RepID=UPI0024359D0A|nr:hypothetical protein [Bradyrhizobium sp. CB1650]WGD50473.1 hypothetical protein QA641_33515 [Bradyrhizobium sp. CB1650]
MVKLSRRWREVVVRRGLTLFVFLVAALAGQSSASAGDWQRLSDGRVVIDIKGVRLALPEKGSDLRLIKFGSEEREMAQFGGHAWEITLERVLESPDEVRDLFSRSGMIHVHIPNVTDRSDLWLTKFNRWELRTLQIGIFIGATAAVANCEEWETDFSRLRASLGANDPRVATDGWAEFVRGRSPVSRIYLQVQSPAFISGLTCDALRSCYAPKCLSSDVGFSYQFNENVHGRTTWTAFNAKATDVLKLVLIDLVK